jgi:hypothetical protein
MKKASCFGSGFSFDFLAHPVGFNVRGQPTVRTKVGSVLSLICMALFVTLSWVTIANYLDTSRPVISYETQTINIPELINIKQSKLYPIIFFFDQIKYVDPDEVKTYVNPYIAYFNSNKTKEPIEIRLKLVPCKELIARGKTDTITASSDGAVRNNYKDFGYCVDDEGKELHLETHNRLEILSVSLYPCALTDGSCKTPDKFGNFAISINFPEAVSNFGDYKRPISYVTETTEWVGLSTFFTVFNYHSLRINEVMQERGFLSKMETTQRYVSVDKLTTQIRNRNSSQTTCPQVDFDYCLPYIVHNLLMTNKKMKIVRSYKGLVESMSEIGGMIGLIFRIFVFMSSFYHSQIINNFLVKEVYGIEKSSKDKNHSAKKIQAKVSNSSTDHEKMSGENYKRAVELVQKDLDILRLLEELNLIKLFLVENYGLQLSKQPDKIVSLQKLYDLRLKPQKDEIDSPRRHGFLQKLSPVSLKKEPSRFASTIRDNSIIFYKDPTLTNSPDQFADLQQKNKKIIHLNSTKKEIEGQNKKKQQIKEDAGSHPC